MDEMGDSPQDPDPLEQADRDWFRAPTPREHRIAAGLFLGFGLFFIALFFFQRNWWFRWVILGLGLFSAVRGLRHLLGAFSSPRG